MKNANRGRQALKPMALFGAAFAMVIAGVPAQSAAASDSAWRIPVCANGEIRYIVMNFGDDGPPPPSDRTEHACHGPCLCQRKRPGRSR